MGQVHVRAGVLEDVGRPVPAIGGLENHLGFGPGGCDGLRELEGLAQDLFDAEGLSVLGHPMDRRAATMQVDSDVLSHRASSSFEVSFCKTELARISQGAEAPPLHRIRKVS